MKLGLKCCFLGLWGLTTPSAVFAVVSGSPGQSAPLARQPGKQPPSVLLITIDTLRADRVGCYGYKPGRTPNLDSLAKQGELFETVVSAAPLTLPSHCSILTGTYPTAHGVRDNVGYTLGPGPATLAEIVKSRGYSTGAFVGAYVVDRRRGLDRGFDTYSSPFRMRKQGEGKVVNVSTQRRKAEEVVHDAVEWLNRNGSKPFFVWVHLYDPHDPYDPPARFRMAFSDLYDAEVSYSDFAIGRLLSFLRARGTFDRTLIVATSDHGESFGEHGEFSHGYFVYDTTLLVPLIIKPPANSSIAPRRFDTPVRLIDIAPTVLQFLDIPIPQTIQGNGLLPLILGKPGDLKSAGAYSESYYPNQFGWSALRALRQQRFKYIDAPKPELYDVRADPSELNNLVNTTPAVASELKAQLNALISRSTPGGGSKPRPSSHEDAESLRALGYLATSTAPPSSIRQEELPDPKDKLAEYRRIMTAGEQVAAGSCSEAVPSLQELTQEDPKLFMAHFLLGRCSLASGEYHAAAAAFHSAVLLQPRNLEALLYEAACQYYLGDLDAASAGLQGILKVQQDYWYAHFYLGLVYQQKQRLESAVIEFQQCIAINPEFEEGQLRLGVILEALGRHADAIPHLKTAVALNADRAEAHYGLALAYAGSGNAEAARPEFKAACLRNSSLCPPP